MEYFISPSKGRMTIDEMFDDILAYIQSNPEDKYKLIIGTDSQSRDDVCFVTAIIIHRLGKGARYYYCRDHQFIGHSLRQRIYYETARSLGVASRIADRLARNGHGDLDRDPFECGEKGQTKDLIREVVGMVVGSGFDARIKPDSFGASKVADKYTK